MYMVNVKKSESCMRPVRISLPPTANTTHMPSIGRSPTTACIPPSRRTTRSTRRYRSSLAASKRRRVASSIA